MNPGGRALQCGPGAATLSSIMKPESPRDLLARMKRVLKMEGVPSFVRRAIVGVVGGTILLIGLAMIFLPGPAVVVIPIGLAILATEFAWARRYLHKARDLLTGNKNKKNRPPPG